jgi:predicted amidophosphoribosyltransferase
MASCPSCNAPVEDGADLCLECGEPMGDAPAAKTARADAVRPPSGPPPASVPPPASARPAPPPSPKTVPAMPAAKKRWAQEEPEPLRCPGCGAKSHAARCPNCGTPLRRDDD